MTFRIELFWSLRESILAPCCSVIGLESGRNRGFSGQFTRIDRLVWYQEGSGCPSKKIQPKQFSKIPVGEVWLCPLRFVFLLFATPVSTKIRFFPASPQGYGLIRGSASRSGLRAVPPSETNPQWPAKSLSIATWVLMTQSPSAWPLSLIHI